MIRSMTGFGRADFEVDGARFDVEVRTVNHRYLDARAKLPRNFAEHEARIKAQAGEHLARGKVDIAVTAVGTGAAAGRLELDLDVARQYLDAADELGRDGRVAGRPDVTALLALPGVARFAEPELPDDALVEALTAGVDRALEAADRMRAREGEALDRELRGRLERVAALADAFEGRSGEVQEAARERLRKRAEQLRQETGLLDEARLHQEIVLAADRLDVTEEVVRLRSHVDQFARILDTAEPGRPVGRRLDFLLQEMGREANTVGSKAGDAPIAHDVVELKTELERIREQVQNVE